jgi:hypothetical protein
MDHLPDIVAFFSLVIGILSLSLVVFIYRQQSSQSTKIESYTKKTNNYVELQIKKHTFVQIDYARRLVVLMNIARMKIHGMNIQIKFLKKLAGNYSPESIKEQEERRVSVRAYQRELQELMSNNNINPDNILTIFDDKVQKLYDKMWKMFVFTDSLMHMGEDYFESMMSFIGTGVEASDKLYKIFDDIIPEGQKITQEKI